MSYERSIIPQRNINSIFEIQPAPRSVYATIPSKAEWLFGEAGAPARLVLPGASKRAEYAGLLYGPLPASSWLWWQYGYISSSQCVERISLALHGRLRSTGRYNTRQYFSLTLHMRSLRLEPPLAYSGFLSFNTKVLQPPTVLPTLCQGALKCW